ncbi:hypothetical protein [Neobacillus sp. NPDC093127]
MDKLDYLEERINAIQNELKVTEMTEKEIDIAFEKWLYNKVSKKLVEKD